MKNPNLYFMRQAFVASMAATCPRKHVGSVIVRDRRVIATGYNGSLPGQPHCEDVGCMIEDGHCIRAVHSEANALLQACRFGVSVEGASIYVTTSPCWPCFKLILGAGLKVIVYGEKYWDDRITDLAKEFKVSLVPLLMPTKCNRCSPCNTERIGCGCDGSMDSGCFLCTPDAHKRPVCPDDLMKLELAQQSWQATFG